MDKLLIEKHANIINDKVNPNFISPYPAQNIEKQFSDIKITYTNKFDNDVCGAIWVDKKNNIFNIVINENKSIKTQNFTIAHELGHYILHKDLLAKSEIAVDTKEIIENFVLFNLHDAGVNQIEKEANYFATCLLLPKEQVEEVWFTLNSIQETAKIFNVSPVTMSIRLKDLNLLQ